MYKGAEFMALAGLVSFPMEVDKAESAPFLEHEEEEPSRPSRDHSSKHGIWRIISFNLFALLLVCNLLWLKVYIERDSPQCVRPKLVNSPAKSVISYEKRRLWRSIEKENVYAGEPRPEHDAAWRKLIEPIAIKITAEELEALDDSASIAFADGSGYLAEMAVFHELHCIKRIRRHLHLDFYYGNMTDDQKERETKHMDHCLEYWREAAMCRGDPTLATFVWYEGRPFSKQYSDHECVNWDRLRGWAESRTVNTSDLSIFKHE